MNDKAPHKDFLGNELKVGDTIVTVNPSCKTSLTKGTIVKLNKHMATIKATVISYSDYYGNRYTQDRNNLTRFYETIVKVPD